MNKENERQKEIVQSIIDDIEEMESIDTEEKYSQTIQMIKGSRFRKMNNRLMRYAAIMAIPLLVASAVFGYLYYRSTVEPVQYAEVRVAAGSVMKYELPDKSVVWLNANSKLKYPVRFRGDKREVSLEGEGYFQVTADKKHPFYVDTPNNMKVFVYGTHFNVSAYSDEPVVETVLEEGKVNVIAPDGMTMVQLNPGEALSYNKVTNQMNRSNVDVYEKTAWIEGKLIFRNATLEEIFKRLSRHFNVKVDFQNMSGRTYHYRATFKNETLPQIMDYLSQSANLKWSVDEPQQQSDNSFTDKRIKVTLY
jgi:transmembrane sensor